MADITSKLVAQFLKIQKMEVDLMPAARILRDEVYSNWQGIDPDATDNEAIAEKHNAETNTTAVVAQPDEGQAKFIEFGTVKMQSQPFVRPAIDSTKDEMVKSIGEEVVKSIKKLI
jgi:HK97 gp10 family phage protein